MVDFRYHLVSIIAIFLALALGIVVGTTELNGLVLDNLRGSISKLSSDKRSLEGTVTDLRGQVSAGDAFASSVGPQLVRGGLSGHSVVLVSTPDAPSAEHDDLVPLLQAAGARVTGSVRLRSDLLDPGRSDALEAVVRAAAPSNVTLPDGQPIRRAAAELALALVRSEGQSAVTSLPARILSAYTSANLVDVPSTLTERADLAVVLTGSFDGGYTTNDTASPSAGSTYDAVLAIARALDLGSAGTVLAGPVTAADAGGPLALLRTDGALSKQVSSVDGADEPEGRIAVVQALAEQLRGGSGSYGRGRAAGAPVPSPSPS